MREKISQVLREALEDKAFVYALWMEGADANGSVDQYSDIDYYVDYEDDYEDEVIDLVDQALESLGSLDYRVVRQSGHPKLGQIVYHIQGTSPYLAIDFNLQKHSRDRKESVLVEGDFIEAAKVIFDKDEIIRYKPLNLKDYGAYNKKRYEDALYRVSQSDRVLKYVYRKQYPEAYAYYNRYLIEPLISLLRLTYTPSHADYYLVHISSHLPSDQVDKLTSFLQVQSLEDIEFKSTRAVEWFYKLNDLLKKEAHFETIN